MNVCMYASKYVREGTLEADDLEQTVCMYVNLYVNTCMVDVCVWVCIRV